MIASAPHRTLSPEGIRIVSEEVPHVPSVSVGVWIGTGSKHEPAGQGGISHFIEHMVFKGTGRRSAYDIALSLESVGGSLDAFTERELTCYCARVLPENLPLAVDVLSDLLSGPRFDAEQMELEKKVVADEIRSFEDDPDDFSHELLARAVWRGHPLAQPVMGSVAGVTSMSREEMIRYFADRYRTGRVVVAAAGAVNHQELVRLVGEHLHLGPGGNHDEVEAPLAKAPRVTVLTREEGQEYVCLGSRAVSYRDEDRYPLHVLSTILGGGMSSRLFQRVREERGLAYSIYTYLECFAETGLLATGLSLKPEWTEEALELISNEFRDFRREGLRPGELETAQAQLRGSTLLSLESTSNRMTRLGRSEFYYDRQVSISEVIASIEAVKPDDVMRVAERALGAEGIAVVLVGPREERSISLGIGEG